MVDRLTLGVALLVLAGCGTPRKPPPPDPPAPRAAPSQPRVASPRPAPAPLATGKAYPECDPRSRDPDRGRVAIGLLAGDCEDDRGRHGVYVTRFAPIGGPSPAQQAGVQVGDRIVRLDTCEVPSTHELALQLRTAVPGWVARLVVERSGREVEVFVPTINLSGRGPPPGERHLSTAGCPAIGRKPVKAG
jgi:membrane-associated protease RseP (regulator of RpoE activity)